MVYHNVVRYLSCEVGPLFRRSKPQQMTEEILFPMMLKVFLPYLKPYRWWCAALMLIILADVGGSLLVPTVTADMINLAVRGAAVEKILQGGLLMLGIALLSGGLTLLGSFISAKLAANLGRDLRKAVYDKSLEFSAADFEAFGTASMITRTLSDVSVIQRALVHFVEMVLPVPLMCVLGILFAFRLHRDMGFLLLGATVFLLLSALLIMGRATAIFDTLQRILDRMNVVLRENLTGVRVVRAFNKEEAETGRLREIFSRYARSAIRANRLFAGLDSLATVTINFVIVAVFYFGGSAIGTGEMEIGDITAVVEYAIWILFYVMMAQMTILMMPRALASLRRVFAVLVCRPEIVDGPAVRQGKPGVPVLAFEAVTFRFADADEETIAGLSFSCLRGTTTAIIGGTGSGKSTVAKLLLRFHDVTAGRITLFGQDIRDISQVALRACISYVPQKAWIFSGTVAENLRYADPDASEETLRRSLRIAQADFVLENPEGLHTIVAQGGTNLSGGQRQRLSIARALTKKADLYVFDDSFSALDFKTDAALRRALAEEVKEAAVLIITQRVSTIRQADQIIVLHDGKLAGIGRHEELLATSPVYRDIVASQQKDGDGHG